MKLYNDKQLLCVRMASKDETRQALNGLYFEGNKTIATDGHRMMIVESKPPRLGETEIEKGLGVEFTELYEGESAFDETQKEELRLAFFEEKHLDEMRENWPANGIAWRKDDEPFTLSINTIEKVLKNMNKKPDFPILGKVAIGLKEKQEDEPLTAVCQITDIANTLNIEGRLPDGRFPNYKQVITTDHDNPEKFQRVSVDAKYLKDICAQLEKYSAGSHRSIILYTQKDKVYGEVIDPEHGGNDWLFPVLTTEKGEHKSLTIKADDGAGTEATAILMPLKI